MQTLKQVFSKVLTSIKSINWKSRRTLSILGVAIVLLCAGIYGLVSLGGAQASVSEVALRPVELIDVSAYTRVGEVKTTESGDREVVVRAEVGGKVTRVVSKGTRVSLGQTLAELENSSQRAALLQADGSLDAAQAGLSKTRRGGRDEQQSILGTNVSSAQANLASTQEATVTSLNSAYAAVDDAVRRKSDPLFSNPDSNVPHFSVPTTETQLATAAENTRGAIGLLLTREAAMSRSGISSVSDLAAEISRTDLELRTIRSYLDTLTVILNKAIATQGFTDAQISAFRTDISTARANVSASISALTAARETLASRAAAVEVAQKNQTQGSIPDEADILSSSASVKQAQGAYAYALAAYQKTIIRAPASGTVIACSPNQGDVINTGADVCRIQAIGGVSGTSFALPLSAVKYTPAGAYVFTVTEDGTLETKSVETGLVSAGSITVAGLLGNEQIVLDIRGLKEGEKVQIVSK